jgi:beta-1,2-mannobiose phosphorylase / 1,2-beta-oligomannan phosphorylase
MRRTGLILSIVPTLIAIVVSNTLAVAAAPAAMPWGDTSRLGRPFAKDPSVIRFGGRYLLYYSLPPFGDKRAGDGWAVGIAESRNLTEWKKVAEVGPEGDWERKGLAAPFAKVIDGKVHLFYQTYGNGPKDAICHAVSDDGLKFTRDPSNPIFHPTGNWNAGRAIDVEVVRFRGRWFLYAATRDPGMKVQMLTGAVSGGGFGRDAWKMIGDGPLLKPELPWEKDCIEAPTVVERNGALYMFYAGAYNNAPQQIGVARSTDGIRWQRMGAEPLVPVGPAGSWNSSESGHPGAFVDEDGQTYLFYQGNNDNGRTWLLSFVKIGWKGDRPFVIRP